MNNETCYKLAISVIMVILTITMYQYFYINTNTIDNFKGNLEMDNLAELEEVYNNSDLKLKEDSDDNLKTPKNMCRNLLPEYLDFDTVYGYTVDGHLIKEFDSKNKFGLE